MAMQVFFRRDRTMIAAPVQCDVDGVPKGSHVARVLWVSHRNPDRMATVAHLNASGLARGAASGTGRLWAGRPPSGGPGRLASPGTARGYLGRYRYPVGRRKNPRRGILSLIVGVITVDHLRKTYGPVVAVDDLSFDVEAGEFFGILGPNVPVKT